MDDYTQEHAQLEELLKRQPWSREDAATARACAKELERQDDLPGFMLRLLQRLKKAVAD
jgi:hypothetical protein